MKRAVAAVLLAGSAALAGAQEHEGCPMKGSPAHRVEVDQRHEATTGVESAGTEHHFLLAKDGGSIWLEARDASQAEALDRIRGHLQTIAGAFAAGDFSMPVGIHAQLPPGAAVMAARRADLRYDYSPSPRGGFVKISTADQAALAAVHDFLRFQIRDHATGDPTE